MVLSRLVDVGFGQGLEVIDQFILLLLEVEAWSLIHLSDFVKL